MQLFKQIRLDKVQNGYLIWLLQAKETGEWVTQDLEEALSIIRELMLREEA